MFPSVRLLPSLTASCTRTVARSLVQAATAIGVRCARARWEADGALAGEVRAERSFVAVSEDGDLLARLCPRVLRRAHGGNFMEIVELDKILQRVQLTAEQVRVVRAVCAVRAVLAVPTVVFGSAHQHLDTPQFQQVCVLAGCDYAKSPSGIAFARALEAFIGCRRSFEEVSSDYGIALTRNMKLH
jgi:hypothetical protein